MPGIPTATMLKLAAIDASFMPSTCRILRRADTLSGGRVTPGAYAQTGSTVNCRLTPSAQSPREFEQIGRLGSESTGTVAMPLGTDVASGDRIEVTTGASVTTFEVVSPPWPGSYSTNLTVEVQREG